MILQPNYDCSEAQCFICLFHRPLCNQDSERFMICLLSVNCKNPANLLLRPDPAVPHPFSFSEAEQHKTRDLLGKRKRTHSLVNKKERQPSSFKGHIDRAMKYQARKSSSFGRLGLQVSCCLPCQFVSIPSSWRNPAIHMHCNLSTMHVACGTNTRHLTAVLSNVLRTCIYTFSLADRRGISIPCYCIFCASAQSQRFAVTFRVTP